MNDLVVLPIMPTLIADRFHPLTAAESERGDILPQTIADRLSVAGDCRRFRAGLWHDRTIFHLSGADRSVVVLARPVILLGEFAQPDFLLGGDVGHPEVFPLKRGTTSRLIQPLPAVLFIVSWLRWCLILIHRVKALIRGGWTQRSADILERDP